MDCQILTRLGPNGPLRTHVLMPGEQASICGATSLYGWTVAPASLTVVTCVACLSAMTQFPAGLNPVPLPLTPALALDG